MALSDGNIVKLDDARTGVVSPIEQPLKAADPTPSKHGGGGGGGPVDTGTKDYVDAKTDATRFQNDARFAEVIARLDKVPSLWQLIATVGSVGLTVLVALVGTFLAVVQFGGDRFDGGMSAASVSVNQAIEARDTAQKNAERINQMDQKVDDVDRKLDVLINILKPSKQQ